MLHNIVGLWDTSIFTIPLALDQIFLLVLNTPASFATGELFNFLLVIKNIPFPFSLFFSDLKHDNTEAYNLVIFFLKKERNT